MTTQGSCHCGAIAFVVDGAPKQAIECNCSHCARKGFLLWFVEPDKFSVVGDEDAMISYRFNRETINHRVCPTCGTQPFARGKKRDGSDMVAVNLRCVSDLDRAVIEIVQVDGKSF